MGARSGIALKSLQWFIRGIQFGCAAIVFGIYTYFLVTLHDHKLNISTTIRAVEGISGSAVLYTILGLLLVCCLGGIAFTSFIAMVIDLAFVGAFIYVAQANKGGASKCTGYVNTPYGRGQANDRLDGKGKISSLPKFHTACKLETACLAVSIVAIFFFIFSIFIEWSLARHHQKEKRFGPGPQNDYTSGSGHSKRRGGIFGKLFGRKNKNVHDDTNNLPEHTHPDQLDHTRPSNVTDTTAVAPGEHQPYHKQETGYGYAANDTAYQGETYQRAPTNNLNSGDTYQQAPTSNPYSGDTYQHAPTSNPYSGDTYQHAPTSYPYSSDTYQHNTYRGTTNANTLPQDYNYNDGVYDRV